MGANVEDQGSMYERMEEDKTNYAELCRLKNATKTPPPLHEGALIFFQCNLFFPSEIKELLIRHTSVDHPYPFLLSSFA